nr:MAG: hypothetical protein [Bacteriophage sp.]
MNKNTNIKTLFHILNGCLPYEYGEKLVANENTIIITKEDSDNTMSITLDDDADDVIAIGHDDPNRGYFTEYEPIYRSSEDEQIPLNSIIDNIKQHL